MFGKDLVVKGKDDSFVYIPILQTLQSLLNNQVILSEVYVYNQHIHI